MGFSPAEGCPTACQAYFDQVRNDCSAGDVLAEALGITIYYREYTVWGEFYGMYPECNLGYTATPCDVALGALENAVFGSRSKSTNSPCSAECRALIDAVNANCTQGPATYVPTCCEL